MKPGKRVTFTIRGDEVVLKPERPGEEFVEYFCTTSAKQKKRVKIKGFKKAIEEQYYLR